MIVKKDGLFVVKQVKTALVAVQEGVVLLNKQPADLEGIAADLQ